MKNLHWVCRKKISEDEGLLNNYDDGTTIEAAIAGSVDCIDRPNSLSMEVRKTSARTGPSKAHTYREIDEETGLDLFDHIADP